MNKYSSADSDSASQKLLLILFMTICWCHQMLHLILCEALVDVPQLVSILPPTEIHTHSCTSSWAF